MDRGEQILLRFSKAKEMLEENKYHIQEIKSCGTCQHFRTVPYTYCDANYTSAYAKVEQIGICNEYQKRR